MLDPTYGNVPFFSPMMKGKLVKRRVPLVPDPRSVVGSRSHEATPAFSWNLSAHALQATTTGTYCPISGLWSAAVQGREVTVLLLEGQMMPRASGQPVQWAFIALTNFDAVGSPIGSRNKRK